MKVKLPFTENCKKIFANIMGRPFFWFDFKYLPDHEVAEVVFDYNAEFLNELAELGYDVNNDPDGAVVEYVSNCAASSLDNEEDDQ